MRLNNIQKKVIHLVQGPCLILAGAGSGKTSVVIKKIITLIILYGYQPKNIFAVTFTNKAVQEIQFRLLKYLNITQIRELNIFTFHAFGLKIIQKEYIYIGIKKNFNIINEKEKLKILKNLVTLKYKNNIVILKKILLKISSWKNHLLSPFFLKNNKKYFLDRNFIEFYNLYSLFLKKNNILDFDDLIFLPVLLFQKNQLILDRWKKKIRYLLVDEYQDTNNMQYQLIKLICFCKPNFTFVGDDDQSIYSWRGAQPKNFILLKNDFPNVKIIKLEQNYRSSGYILKAANQLISNNPNFFNKKLFSKKKNGAKIHIFKTLNEISEAREVLKYIFSHQLLYNTKYKDYAILYRSNYQSRFIETELIYQKIPYHIHEGTSFLETLEIKILISYLRLIINHNDDISFLKVINTPCRKIGLITLKKIKDLANKFNLSLFQTITHSYVKKKFKKNTILILKKFSIWIHKISTLIFTNSKEIFYYLLKELNFIDWIKNISKDQLILKNRLRNINFFIFWFKRMLKGNNFYPSMKFQDVLLYISCGYYNTLSLDKKKNNNNKLNLMTIHAAKGLEFLVVFIIGLEEGIFPHKKNIIEKNIFEERRLMYVGITRAKKQLCFSFCGNKFKFGTLNIYEPSRFLLELPKDVLFLYNFYKN